MKKILTQFLKEFSIPLIISIIWAYLNINFENVEYLSITKNFGAAFFLSSWLGGQLLRINKQIKTSSSFSDITTRLETVSKQMESSLESIEGFTTGGNSFCYFDIHRYENDEYIIGLIHEGKYPVYDIEVAITNLNSEEKDIVNAHRLYFDTLAKGNVRKLGFDEENPVFLEDNENNYLKYSAHFYTRQGSHIQDIRFIKFENEWHFATRVRIGDKTIFSQVPENYPLKEPFE